MHLSSKENERFYRLFYPLLNYANEVFSVLNGSFEPSDEEVGPVQVMALCEYVFDQENEVIDRYVVDNPDNFNSRDLAQIAQWKWALTDTFFLVENGAAYSMFMGCGCLFHVMGLAKDISDVIQETPAAVTTTLLPFGKYIVYADAISCSAMDMGESLEGILYSDCARLRSEGKLATFADEFLSLAPSFLERLHADRV